jgi:hypothetical protein
MQTYSAYRLNIASELPFPELTITAAEPDIYIRIRPLDTPEAVLCFGPGSYTGETELGRLLLNNGRELVLDPLPGIDEAVLRPFMLGPALALLLRQRGLLTIHASSVAIDGAAVAFVGNTGWGKSTLAKAFHAQGYALVTDDLLAIDLSGDKAVIAPSFPLIKLWPDSAEALGDDPSHFSRLHEGTDKLVHCLSEGFQDDLVLLKRIFILGKGDEISIARLAPQDALVHLIAHSWGVKNFTERHFQQSHLEQCAQLVNQVAVSHLKRPKDLQLIPEIMQAILADLDDDLGNNERETASCELPLEPVDVTGSSKL